MTDTHYENRDRVAAASRDGGHRAVVGGMWDEIGQLQFDMMRAQGLQPDHTMLDIGCGALRGGRHFIPYLDPFHYFGLDLNQSLIDAGLTSELDAAAATRIGPGNFRANDDFTFDFDAPPFDYALALSLFTHLSDNRIRLCLENLLPCMRSGGWLLATVFENPDRSRSEPIEQFQGIVTWSWKDPYHYRRTDLDVMAQDTGWTLEWLGNFDHPRNQQLCRFVAP